MPPYKKNKSKAQERLMFALAKKGELPMSEAVGKAKATKKSWKGLPEHVKPKKKKAKK